MSHALLSNKCCFHSPHTHAASVRHHQGAGLCCGRVHVYVLSNVLRKSLVQACVLGCDAMRFEGCTAVKLLCRWKAKWKAKCKAKVPKIVSVSLPFCAGCELLNALLPICASSICGCTSVSGGVAHKGGSWMGVCVCKLDISVQQHCCIRLLVCLLAVLQQGCREGYVTLKCSLWVQHQISMYVCVWAVHGCDVHVCVPGLHLSSCCVL